MNVSFPFVVSPDIIGGIFSLANVPIGIEHFGVYTWDDVAKAAPELGPQNLLTNSVLTDPSKSLSFPSSVFTSSLMMNTYGVEASYYRVVFGAPSNTEMIGYIGNPNGIAVVPGVRYLLDSTAPFVIVSFNL